MRYQPALLIYTCLLLTGLASAGLTGWVERPAFLSAQWLLPVAGLALLGAAYLLSLMAAGVMFPTAWRQQRMNQDHQLIWKNFPRTNRRGPRMSWWVHGMIQPAPRPTRQWDGAFLALTAALLMAHSVLAYGASRQLAALLPQRLVFSQSMHQPLLTGLPLMREWKTSWEGGPKLRGRIESQTREWSARQSRNVQDWFRMAQLHLLMAFRSRNSFIKPYRVAPDEPYSFDEEQAEKATGYLKRIMDTPLAQREGLTPTILALDGFIRFSQGNYREAEVLFTRSLASFSSGEQKGLPRYMVMLLASRAYIQNGKLVAAQRVLSSILGDERMVPLAFPLAMEQKAEIIRLSFDGKDYKGLLSEASYRFQKESDQNGVARVHLHLAAFALEQDRPQMVRREISLASSLATGLNDWFTLGMAGYLYQTLPRD